MEKRCHFRIYWKTRNKEAIRQIREKFGMPNGTTVNGETEADIDAELVPLLRETARRGFIQIRKQKYIIGNESEKRSD